MASDGLRLTHKVEAVRIHFRDDFGKSGIGCISPGEVTHSMTKNMKKDENKSDPNQYR